MRELADDLDADRLRRMRAKARFLANFRPQPQPQLSKSVDAGAQPASLTRTQDRPGGRTSGDGPTYWRRVNFAFRLIRRGRRGHSRQYQTYSGPPPSARECDQLRSGVTSGIPGRPQGAIYADHYGWIVTLADPDGSGAQVNILSHP